MFVSPLYDLALNLVRSHKGQADFLPMIESAFTPPYNVHSSGINKNLFSIGG